MMSTHSVKGLHLTVADTKTGSQPPCYRDKRGFTLIELMIVMTIIAILAAIAIPNYQRYLIRAREAVLQENLYGIRSAIDQFYADQGKYPDAFTDLVDKKYMREIPRDPITGKNDTWVAVAPVAETPSGTGGGMPSSGASSLPKGNVYDVQSGSNLIGTNGVPYNEW